jgi:hypothetical protein
MTNCNNKISHTCGSGKNYAVCIETEGEVNTDSALIEESCTNLQENLDDIYNQLGNLDLSALGDLCLSYTTIGGKNIVKNVLLKFEEKICELEEKITELETVNICNQNIVPCNLDFGTLTTACGDQPATLAEAIQLILDTLNTP